MTTPFYARNFKKNHNSAEGGVVAEEREVEAEREATEKPQITSSTVRSY